MTQGHVIATIDIAKLFSSRGLKATIISTPFHAPLLSSKTFRNDTVSESHSDVLTIEFPSVENGLPQGCESFHMVDFPWNLLLLSVCYSMRTSRYSPRKHDSSDSETFVIPNLQDDIEFTRNELLEFQKNDVENVITKMFKARKEAEERSYGTVVNSFHELEPVYADHYRKSLGIEAWHIGPLFLYNKSDEDKAKRGLMESYNIEGHECLKWLNAKKRNSVVYAYFGSLADLNVAQLLGIALALEASGKEFV